LLDHPIGSGHDLDSELFYGAGEHHRAWIQRRGKELAALTKECFAQS
jgi:hypothetical protein